MRMMLIRRLALGTSLCALAICTPALAQAGETPPQDAPSNAELATLVKAQATEIAELKQRLAAVEAHEQQAGTAPALATPPALASAGMTPEQAQQARANAEVAAATQSSAPGAAPAASGASAEQLAAMETQIAQLADASRHSVKVDWDEGGPTFKSADDFFTFHPEGRIVADVSKTGGSNYAARNITGTEFRDLRLGAEGNIGKLGYDIEVDFAGNKVSVKEAYISYTTKLFGMRSKSSIGNSLNDRTIEGDTELVFLPFAERNAVASVTAPQIGYFGLGAAEELSGKGWHLGVAIKGDDISGNTGTTSDDIAYFARAHVNPILNANSFVHIGGWGYHESLVAPTAINATASLASDFNSEVQVSPSSIAGVKSDNGYGGEIGGGYRSLWGFAEFGDRILNVPGPAQNVDQKAWSAYGGWFITGEHLNYSPITGSFTQPHVLRPLTSGGPGAFELLGRYDNYDFKDAARGGNGRAVTLAGTWFLNDIFDIKMNYILWRTDNIVGSYPGKDDGHTLLVRGELSF